MKISLITLHRVRNYGSSLQTLATQVLFEKKGATVEIIDYYQERYQSRGLLRRLKNKSQRLNNNAVLLFIAKAMISVSYLKKKLVFDSFLKKYLHLTAKTYYTDQELCAAPPQADAYCTGSDQVWNSHWNEGIDYPLYLHFLKENQYRFSYASSIGNDVISAQEKATIKPLLAKYNHVSVREDSGKLLLEQIGVSAVQQLVDPTLMFDQSFWNRYTCPKRVTCKYVLTYNLHHDSKIDLYAAALAKKKNLKVFHISYNWHDVVRKGRLQWCPSVERYLSLIRDAEYVVTDSFHATVFSIIFQKQFIDIFPEQAGTRLQSLLTLTETKTRGSVTTPSLALADEPIDFLKIQEILKQEREKTHTFLDMVLKEVERSIAYENEQH